MKKWMYDCVLETPETCSYILKNRIELTGKLVELYLEKSYKKIVMVASGSSYNIAQCARYAIENYLGVKVECINSVTYAKYDYKFHEYALIICMSQSGKSTNTIDAVKRAKSCGNDAVAISMIPDSPISKYCGIVMEYGSKEMGEDVFVCRGVPSSTLFFILFALEAAVKSGFYPKDYYKYRIKEIETIIREMPRIREKTDAFYNINKNDFYSMKRVMITGLGPSIGVAAEGALKIEETVGIPSNAYETEEFLHGPAYEVKKDHAVFLVDLDNEMHERNALIYEAVKELTDRVYIITAHPSPCSERILHIDVDCCKYLRPLLFVMPFQIMASRICDDLRISALTVYNYRCAQIVKTKEI